MNIRFDNATQDTSVLGIAEGVMAGV